jgi:stage III sporulation protein AC
MLAELKDVMQIAMFAIIISLIAGVVKKAGKDNEATIVGLIGLVVVIGWFFVYMQDLFEVIQATFLF